MAVILMICILFWQCFSYSFNVYLLEELKNVTCENIYQHQTGYDGGNIDFSKSINGLRCPQETYYNCVPDTKDRSKFIQFCADWIWIEKGKCPAYYSYQSKIQPYDCSANVTGCPIQQYKSHEYYKYGECFKSHQSSKAAKKSGELPKEGQSATPWIIGCVILVAVIIVMSVLFGLYIRRRKRTRHSLGDNEEVMNMLLQDMPFTNDKAISAAEGYLSETKHVIIAGKPGSGRETLIRQLYHRFPRLVFKNPKYRKFHLKANKNYFIVVNERWLKDYELGSLQHEMKDHNESVLAIELSQSYLEIEQEKGNLKPYEDAVVNLSSETFELDERERKRVIATLCAKHNVEPAEFSDAKRSDVCRYELKHYGFFYLCEKLIEEKEFEDPLTYVEKIDRC